MQDAVIATTFPSRVAGTRLLRLIAGVTLVVSPVALVAVLLELSGEPPTPCVNPFTCVEVVVPRSAFELFSVATIGVAAGLAWVLAAFAVVRNGWPHTVAWIRSILAITLFLGAEAATLTALALLQSGNGRRSAVFAAAIAGVSWAVIVLSALLAGRAFRGTPGGNRSTRTRIPTGPVVVSVIVLTPTVVLLVLSLLTNSTIGGPGGS